MRAGRPGGQRARAASAVPVGIGVVGAGQGEGVGGEAGQYRGPSAAGALPCSSSSQGPRGTGGRLGREAATWQPGRQAAKSDSRSAPRQHPLRPAFLAAKVRTCGFMIYCSGGAYRGSNRYCSSSSNPGIDHTLPNSPPAGLRGMQRPGVSASGCRQQTARGHPPWTIHDESDPPPSDMPWPPFAAKDPGPRPHCSTPSAPSLGICSWPQPYGRLNSTTPPPL